MLRTDEKVLSRPSKKQILTVLPKGCKKSALKKNSVEKSVTWFVGFAYNISSKVVEKFREVEWTPLVTDT